MSSHAVGQAGQFSQPKTESLEALLNRSFLNQPLRLRKCQDTLTGLSLLYFQTNHHLNGIMGLPDSSDQFAVTIGGRRKVNPP